MSRNTWSIRGLREEAKGGRLPVALIVRRDRERTRGLDAQHVVALAESIAALGLIEPVVVDKHGQLLAGSHRLAAIRLLVERDAVERVERFRREVLGAASLAAAAAASGSDVRQSEAELCDRVATLVTMRADELREGVPIYRMPIDASMDRDQALAIEIAENEHRRDYTPQEVAALHDRLVAAGYVDRPGPRRPGEKSAQQALATVIGKHMRTVRRLLRKARHDDAALTGSHPNVPNETTQMEMFVASNTAADRSLLRAIVRWQADVNVTGREDDLYDITERLRLELRQRCRLQPVEGSAAESSLGAYASDSSLGYGSGSAYDSSLERRSADQSTIASHERPKRPTGYTTRELRKLTGETGNDGAGGDLDESGHGDAVPTGPSDDGDRDRY